MFNWFTSLAPNSINHWPSLEQKFHDYFYNGEVELRLSDLTTVRQKYGESVPEYLRRFREMRNRCYNLTIGEKDLGDLAFAGLSSYLKEKMEGHEFTDVSSYLKEKMEGHEFTDVNQVLQQAAVHGNCAKEHRAYNRFKETWKEKPGVNFVDEESAEDGDAEVCVAEWVDTPKPVSCSLLRHNADRKEEMKCTFDVTKCDKLFGVLVQGGIIRLKECHVIPAAELIAKKKYCKWHNSYSHTTNKCNYFR
jgi:hypothetical protein